MRALVRSLVVASMVFGMLVEASAQSNGREIAVEADDPSLADGLLAGRSGVAIEGGTKQETARIKVSFATGFFATVSTPVRDGSSETRFVDSLDGLADSMTAALGYTGMVFPERDPNTFIKMAAICRRVGIDPETEECDDQTIRNMDSPISKRAWREFLHVAFPGPVKFWSVEGKVGRNEFDFLGTEETVARTTKVPTSLAFGAGLISVSRMVFAKVRWDRRFEKGETGTICEQIQGSAAQDCAEVSVLQPAAEDRGILSGGARFFGENLAVSPTVAVGLGNGHFGFEIPVYFIPNGSGAYTGGARFGWQREEGGFVAVFLGTALGLGI